MTTREQLWANVYAHHVSKGAIWFRAEEEANLAVKSYDRNALAQAAPQPMSAEARLKRANLLIASIPYTEYLFSAQNAYVEKERAERYARTLLIAALSPQQAEPGKGEV